MREWLEARQPALVDDSLRDRMAQELGVEPAALRAPLRAAGVPLSPMVEGVRQDTPAELARTLHALSVEYEAAGPERRRAVRAEVIQARQHAGWAARAASDEKRAGKEEVLLWLRTWLENPPLFPVWAELRRSRIDATEQPPTA